MFSTEDLQKELNTKQVIIPDGHTKALVIHGDLEDKSVTASFVTKVGKDWQIDASTSWKQDKGIDAGFNVTWSK